MAIQQPTTETLKISEVKQQLNSLVNRVHRREIRVMVEKASIPIAGIVSPEDLQRLDRLDRQRAERHKALYEFAAGFADQTPEEIERETAHALAEVRAEQRAENFNVLDEIGKAFKDVPEDELEREVARAIAEVLANRRAERDQAEPESSSA